MIDPKELFTPAETALLIQGGVDLSMHPPDISLLRERTNEAERQAAEAVIIAAIDKKPLIGRAVMHLRLKAGQLAGYSDLEFARFMIQPSPDLPRGEDATPTSPIHWTFLRLPLKRITDMMADKKFEE